MSQVKESINDPYDIIKYPLSTEKSIRLIASNNSLVFVVNKRSIKGEIKNAIEEMFKVKVKSVNTSNDINGRKLVYVRFSDETTALEIATQLGIM